MTVLATALVFGCKEPEEIRQYSVNVAPLPTATHRMLVAIVPDDHRGSDTAGESSDDTESPESKSKRAVEQVPHAWFFKLVAPINQIAGVESAFDQFIRSVRTRKEGLPEWILPEGWAQDAGGRAPGFGREATILIGEGDAQLELTVSKLPMQEGLTDGWVVLNINRWREQMKLPPISRSELDEHSQKLVTGEQTAIKVDLAGTFSGPPMMGRLAGAKRAHDQVSAPSSVASKEATVGDPQKIKSESQLGRPPFDADVPEGWKPGRAGGMRAAAYTIESEDQQPVGEVTVIPLGPGASDLKANVDRWRQEIKLAATKPEELASETRSIEIEGQKADYVHLVGPDDARPREATLGVILRRPDRVWFFKLRGPVEVVAREKERFEEFVKSVKFK